MGADHPNKRGPARRFELALCLPGEAVELVPEPKNPMDGHAIAVFSARGVQLGYLTAERAPWIGGMLKNGREIAAVFQAQAAFGAWIRVAFDGEQPLLPAPAAAAATLMPQEDDSGFWPDPVYDD